MDWLDRFIADYEPCRESIRWLQAYQFATPQEAWDACQNPEWMLWVAMADDTLDDRLLKFICKLIRIYLADIFQDWDYLHDLETHGYGAYIPEKQCYVTIFDTICSGRVYFTEPAWMVRHIEKLIVTTKYDIEKFRQEVAEAVRQEFPDVPLTGY